MFTTTDDDTMSKDAPASSSPLEPPVELRLSISAQATAASTRRLTPPSYLKWIEYPFRIKNVQTNTYLEEATGHAMDCCARGPINQAGSFVGISILTLAAIEAGGPNNTVYGIRVSSLLTLGNMVAGILAAVTMPIMGALIDHTDHRKTFGVVSAFVVITSLGAQLIVSYETWFIVYLLEIIGGYFMIMHQLCINAYIPDLTHDTVEIGHYTARLMMIQYLVQGSYTTIVILATYINKMSSLQTTRLGVAMALALGLILFGYAWLFLFRKRPKLRDVPEGQSIVTTGFKQIFQTIRVVFRKYSALKWFMISLLWCPEAGAGTVLVIAVTFLTLYVKMTVAEISIASLVMLFSNIPGAIISRYMCKKINPLNSFRGAALLFAISNGLLALTVTGPEKKNLVYLFSVLIGASFGWLFPSQRTVAVSFVPKGQETEIFGHLAFFAQSLGWLPTLIFTIMSENGVSMRWGVSILSFFLLTSALCTFMCGDFHEAVAAVAHTSDAYLQEFARRSKQSDSSLYEVDDPSA